MVEHAPRGTYPLWRVPGCFPLSFLPPRERGGYPERDVMKDTQQTMSYVEEQLASGDVKTHVVASPAETSIARNRMGIILSILALYLIWGSTYLGMRIALEGFPPFLLAGVRFLIAGGILYTFLRIRGTPAPRGKQWAGAAVLGALLLVGGNGGVVFAEQWVASGLA